MVTDDEESISVDKCECGSKKYGYYSDKGMIFICFKCGRFVSGELSEKLIELFIDDPKLLMILIKSGYLKPLNDIKDE